MLLANNSLLVKQTFSEHAWSKPLEDWTKNWFQYYYHGFDDNLKRLQLGLRNYYICTYSGSYRVCKGHVYIFAESLAQSSVDKNG